MSAHCASPARDLDLGLSASRRMKGEVLVSVVDDAGADRLLIGRTLRRTPLFRLLDNLSSGEAALKGIPRSRASVVLMDIRMPGLSGTECSRLLKSRLPRLIIVAMSGLADMHTINSALSAGCDAYLAKPFSVGQLLATLTFCRSRCNLFDCRPRELATASQAPVLATLNPRELRVIELLAEGLAYKEVARRLSVTFSNVHKIQNRIFHKFGAKNRTDAVLKFLSQPRCTTPCYSDTTSETPWTRR